MILTKSNVLNGAIPSVTTGLSTSLPDNITDPNFSTLYRSSDSARLTMEFGSVFNINYVAVAGINIAGNGSGSSRVRIYDGGTLLQTINVKRNQVVVFQFETRSFDNLRVGLYNDSQTANPIVRYVAAGVQFTVPNSGEGAGYVRPYLSRNFKNKTTLNGQAEPVGMLRTRTQPKATLSLPNMTLDFCEGEWQEFLDFAESNHFFVSEQLLVQPTFNEFFGSNPASYLGYEVGQNRVSSHNATRTLDNLSISFKVYTGL